MRLHAALAAAALLVGGTASADDMQRAEDLVNGRCFLCHGATGSSSSPLYPKLAGQHPEYLFKQLQNFKQGERESADMRKVVKGLDEKDMRALALFFSRQTPTPGSTAYPEMRAVGERLYRQGNPGKGLKACIECHEEKGSGSEKLPRIGGQHALYIETQLALFEERRRTNDNAQMQEIAAKLSPEEMRALAEYLSGL
jgi:cytochrome c553